MKSFLVSVLLTLVCIASAQDPQGVETQHSPALDIEIELQVVAVPENISFALVRDLKDPAKTEAAYQEIQKLLMNGTAKLIGWPILTTRSGQRAVVESTNEFRYATEFKPGGVGVYLTAPEGQLTIPPKEPEKLKEIKGVELNAMPTAFETRNVGVTLEVEPVTLDGKIIDLNLVPQHVRLKAMNKVTIERPGTGEKIVVEQPEFEFHRITTSLRMKSGERKLLSVFKTSEPAGHLELFILKVEANQWESEKPEKAP